jgi:hypothetical protein
VPIAKLLDPASMDEMTIERGLLTFRAPCYRVGEDRVWGATAVILGEFAAMMERVA